MKTNQIAKLFHLSENTIRNYHKSGLLNPSLEGSKNREFSLEDLNILYRIVRFKDLGVPYNEVEDILMDGDYETIRSTLERACSLLHEEIERKKIREMYLQYVVDNLNVDHYLINRISFEKSPALRYLELGSAESIQMEESIMKCSDELQKWTEYAGCINFVEICTIEDVRKGNTESAVQCISILDEFAQLSSNNSFDETKKMQGGPSIVTVVCDQSDPNAVLQRMNELLDYAEHENIHLRKDQIMLKKQILTTVEGKYYKLYLPIEEVNRQPTAKYFNGHSNITEVSEE